VGSFMTASWKPGPLSQSCFEGVQELAADHPLEKRVVDPSSEPGEIAAGERAEVHAGAARDHDALVRRRVSAGTFERESSAITLPRKFQASVLTVPQRLLPHSFPRPLGGGAPPVPQVPQNEISNLTVGKPIAISLAATGAMPNVGVRRSSADRPDRAAYPRPAPETRTAAGTRR